MLLKFTFVSDNFALLQGFFASLDKEVKFTRVQSSNEFELVILDGVSEQRALEIVDNIISFAGGSKLSYIELVSEGEASNVLRRLIIEKFIQTYTGKKNTKISRIYLVFDPGNGDERSFKKTLNDEKSKALRKLRKKVIQVDEKAEKAKREAEKEEAKKTEGKGKEKATAVGGVAEPEDEDRLVHSGSSIVVHGKAASPIGSVVGSSSSGSIEEKVPKDVPGELAEVLKQAVRLVDRPDYPTADIVSYLYAAEKKYFESCREQNQALAGRRSRFEREIAAFHECSARILQPYVLVWLRTQIEEFPRIREEVRDFMTMYGRVFLDVPNAQEGQASDAVSVSRRTVSDQPLLISFRCHQLLNQLEEMRFLMLVMSANEDVLALSGFSELCRQLQMLRDILAFRQCNFKQYDLVKQFPLISQIKSELLKRIILERAAQEPALDGSRFDEEAVTEINAHLSGAKEAQVSSGMFAKLFGSHNSAKEIANLSRLLQKIFRCSVLTVDDLAAIEAEMRSFEHSRRDLPIDGSGDGKSVSCLDRVDVSEVSRFVSSLERLAAEIKLLGEFRYASELESAMTKNAVESSDAGEASSSVVEKAKRTEESEASEKLRLQEKRDKIEAEQRRLEEEQRIKEEQERAEREAAEKRRLQEERERAEKEAAEKRRLQEEREKAEREAAEKLRLQVEREKAEKAAADRAERAEKERIVAAKRAKERYLELAANSSEMPAFFRCPITYELMKNPVITPAGHTYERQAIEQWINEHHTDPQTRERLEVRQLIPNRVLREQIDEWLEMMVKKLAAADSKKGEVSSSDVAASSAEEKAPTGAAASSSDRVSFFSPSLHNSDRASEPPKDFDSQPR